jgi:hypothetical protein
VITLVVDLVLIVAVIPTLGLAEIVLALALQWGWGRGRGGRPVGHISVRTFIFI